MAALAVFSCNPVQAQDSWKEAQTYSGIDMSGPDALANGTINCSRVPISGSALNIGTESNYLLPVSVDQAAGVIRRVEDSTTENDYLLSKPAAIDNFRKLNITDSSLKTLKWLNLSTAEKGRLSDAFKNGSSDKINSTWSAILLDRATTFQSNGLLKAEPYDLGGTPFKLAPELVGLLKQRAPVLKRFVSVMDEIMTGKPGTNLPVVYYWENEKIQGSQNIGLGAVHALKTATGYQLADLTYYSASSYYISITLHELWPVTVNGKAQTYVWRGDYVISPSIGYTRGIERMAAENIMILEVKSTIKDQINLAAKAK
jgi:hypothetical protein